jgi:hypothetical protein
MCVCVCRVSVQLCVHVYTVTCQDSASIMQLLQLFLPLSALHHAQITREAGPVKGGSSVIAFAKDPTGYMWELIQRPAGKEPLCQACTACLCVFWGGGVVGWSVIC